MRRGRTFASRPDGRDLKGRRMLSFVKRTILSAVHAAGYDLTKRTELQPATALTPTTEPPPASTASVAPTAAPAIVKTLQDRWTERTLMLAGVEAVRSHRTLQNIDALSDVEVCVYSQFGEDGILDWLVAQLPISRPQFVEFGVGNYLEANTRFLLKHRNWRGLVLEGSAFDVATIKTDDVYWAHDLTAIDAFITAENISSIIKKAGFDGPIGLLSVDIDGNDYWVLRELLWLRPDLIICEYNAVLGDLHPTTIPYQPGFDRRTVAGASRLYYGASIQAFVSLLNGYTLAGSNTAGNNAFFVRNDLFAQIPGGIADTYPRPSLFRESLRIGWRTHVPKGPDTLDQIKSMPVVDLRSGEQRTIESLGTVYSDRWLSEMGRH